MRDCGGVSVVVSDDGVGVVGLRLGLLSIFHGCLGAGCGCVCVCVCAR